LVSCVNRNSVRLTNADLEVDVFINRLKGKQHIAQRILVYLRQSSCRLTHHITLKEMLGRLVT
jgi:hypothetical protein